MSGYMINWITMTLVFLLPLIPAFLLYRFLSAQAEMGESCLAFRSNWAARLQATWLSC